MSDHQDPVVAGETFFSLQIRCLSENLEFMCFFHFTAMYTRAFYGKFLGLG